MKSSNSSRSAHLPACTHRARASAAHISQEERRRLFSLCMTRRVFQTAGRRKGFDGASGPNAEPAKRKQSSDGHECCFSSLLQTLLGLSTYHSDCPLVACFFWLQTFITLFVCVCVFAWHTWTRPCMQCAMCNMQYAICRRESIVRLRMHVCFHAYCKGLCCSMRCCMHAYLRALILHRRRTET